MKTVSATEAKQSLGALLDEVRRQPISIQRHDRAAAVLVSPDWYEEYRKLKAERVMEICRQASAYAESQGMNEEVLAKLLAGDDDE